MTVMNEHEEDLVLSLPDFSLGRLMALSSAAVAYLMGETNNNTYRSPSNSFIAHHITSHQTHMTSHHRSGWLPWRVLTWGFRYWQLQFGANMGGFVSTSDHVGWWKVFIWIASQSLLVLTVICVEFIDPVPDQLIWIPIGIALAITFVVCLVMVMVIIIQ